VEDNGDIEVSIVPSSYFESQKGLDEWIECAETVSLASKIQFLQSAEETQVLLAQAEL